MGNTSSKKKVIPINENKYQVSQEKIITLNEERYILENEYKKLVKKNINLELKVSQLTKKDFECIVCYSRDRRTKVKIRCQHHLCRNCFDIIRDRRCPICRITIK